MGSGKEKKSSSHKHKSSSKHKKHKKERKRARSSSSSGSGSDSEEERARQRAERKARKVEEYWSKQASKQGGGDGPAKFVWGKKIERDLLAGKDVREFTASAVGARHQERMAEVERVQRRREERELERERAEEEMALLQRQRLAAEAVEQEQKEEEFHLQQARVRAARRIAQGRAKPIDWLIQDVYGSGDGAGGVGGEEDELLAAARNNNDGARGGAEDDDEEHARLRRQLGVSDEEWERERRREQQQQQRYGGGRGGHGGTGPGSSSSVPVVYGRPRGLAAEPYLALAGLSAEELLELRDEVRGYEELEQRVTPANAEYWACLVTLADHELEAARAREQQGGGGGLGGNSAAAQQQQQQLAAAARVVGAPIPAAAGRGAAAGGAGGGGSGVHASVQREIEALLAGQTHAQLAAMERDVSRQLAAGEGDPEYWEAVLPRLRVYAAKARLREIKAAMLEQRLAAQEGKLDVAAAMGWLDEEEEEADAHERHLGVDGVPFPSGTARLGNDGDEQQAAEPMDADEQQQAPRARPRHPDEELEEAFAARGGEDEQAAAAAAAGPSSPRHRPSPSPSPAEEEEQARLSPPPVASAELASGQGVQVVHEDEDRRRLELLRAQVRLREAEKFVSAAEAAAAAAGAGSGRDAAERVANPLLDPKNRFRGTGQLLKQMQGAGGELETGVGSHRVPRRLEERVDDETRAFREQAARSMGVDPGDAQFGCEVPLEAQAYAWHQRYAPRKPKYFNRVHTGYEWTKYNKTHYDHENPPPKVVQGYKFNIYYPDLLDKSKAPTYRVERDPSGARDTCLLVFSAGPPYEELAFRIVNKEWETTGKHGFKCAFDRGILQLYFNFKRARYRR